MALFNCSFHNHTVLSPCADLTMTADFYKEYLLKSNINWIAITDHNSTRNVKPFIEYFKDTDIKIIPGIEIQTIEEIHLVVLFKYLEDSEYFGNYIEKSLMIKEYDPEKFGYQICLDNNSEFLSIIESPFLGSSSSKSINEIIKDAYNFETIIFPAHIFRSFGLITQLGLPPKDLYFDAVEVKKENEINLAKKLGFDRFIFGNDSHTPDQLIHYSCQVESDNREFDSLKKAIYNKKVFPKWPH